MPEYLIVLTLTSVLGGFGFLAKKVNLLDDRLDKFQVKVAESYVTRINLDHTLDTIMKRFDRFEDKLDATYRVESERLALIKQAYQYKQNND